MKLDTIKVSRQRLGGKYNTNSKFSHRNYIELSPKNKPKEVSSFHDLYHFKVGFNCASNLQNNSIDLKTKIQPTVFCIIKGFAE